MAWSREEVEATVSDYLHMLRLELAGQRYNKTAHRRALISRLNQRSDSAVEMKHQNVSAVLLELGWPFIPGYKPARNYQRLLAEVVAERISMIDSLDALVESAVDLPATMPAINDFRAAPTEAPRVRALNAPPPQNSYLSEFTAVKRDYVEREARNAALGAAGEAFAIEYERWRLIRAGNATLADKIEQVSKTQGDGLGYDILSYENNGKPRLIEVKTTSFAKETPFIVTKKELERSKADAEIFHVYRLFEFRRTPRFFSLKGSLDRHCLLDPVTYRARFS